jgi:hypothetical protein
VRVKPKGLLMDVPAIRQELGVTEHVATKILRHCAQQRFVQDEELAKKTWVYREDVEAWLAAHTRSAA